MISLDKAHLSKLPILSLILDENGNIIFKNFGKKIDFVDKQFERILHLISDDFKELIKSAKSDKIITGERNGVVFSIQRVEFEGETNKYLVGFNIHKLYEAYFRDILNHIDEAVIVFDKDLNIEIVNESFANYTGLEFDKYQTGNLYELIKLGVVEDPISPYILKSKETVRRNVKYRTGSILTLTGIPILDNDNNVDKVVITGINITDQIKLKEKLQKVEVEKSVIESKVRELEVFIGQHNLIYSSNEMKQVVNVAIKAAKSDSAIFLWGESGVGKEVIANFIHKSSPRKDRPFIAINCAAIPSELLESELFGYEGGAFTGAKAKGKKGVLVEAEGGTVFLDEIGELPMLMQSKLLRVLQEKKITRIGDSASIPIDVRFISATNLSSESLMDEKKFRKDLYFRLSVIPIHILPLRERREDIFPLVKHFLKTYNNMFNKNVSLSKEVMKSLYQKNWQGNVRELKNIIERLVILSDSDVIEPKDYDEVCRFDIYKHEEPVDFINTVENLSLNDALGKLEEFLITKALNETGNIVKAAELLGIAPSTIYRKIKKGEIISSDLQETN